MLWLHSLLGFTKISHVSNSQIATVKPLSRRLFPGVSSDAPCKLVAFKNNTLKWTIADVAFQPFGNIVIRYFCKHPRSSALEWLVVAPVGHFFLPLSNPTCRVYFKTGTVWDFWVAMWCNGLYWLCHWLQFPDSLYVFLRRNFFCFLQRLVFRKACGDLHRESNKSMRVNRTCLTSERTCLYH